MASNFLRNLNSEDSFTGFVNNSEDEHYANGFVATAERNTPTDEHGDQPVIVDRIIDYDPVELMDEQVEESEMCAPVVVNDDLATQNEADMSNDNSTSRISDVLFSTALENCGIALLKKSQTLAMKAKKKKATREMIDFILLRKGIQVTEQQISKKINNMKTRIKNKTDMKATGNKKIDLNEGEKIFYRLLGAEENPTVVKLPCK